MCASARARRRAAGHAGGFTLLEVLVAVAVLGILYSVLGRVAIQHLQYEGEAARRLEASLLADAAVLEIESQAALGVAPPLGQQETPLDGGYLLVVEVIPLELAIPEPELPRGREAPPGTAGDPPVSLLEFRDARGQPALRRVELRVLWQEGAGERSVRRTTFALDRALASEVLQELAPGVEGGVAAELASGEDDS